MVSLKSGSSNTRRRFLKNSVAGLGLLSLPSSLQSTEIEQKTPVSSTIEEYSENVNFPLFPKQIFLPDDTGTPLYKKSMFTRFADLAGIDINLVTTGTSRKVIEINDPTYIKGSEVGDSGRLILNKMNDLDRIIYKEVSFIKGNSADKKGSTVKLMSMGDSLTEGGTPVTSPLYLLKQKLEAIGVSVQAVGTLKRSDGTSSYHFEGRGGWRYRTFVGLESQFAGLNIVIPPEDRSEWTEGTDGKMNVIKANNVFLYEATRKDKSSYPQWCFNFIPGNKVNNVNYLTNPTLGKYYIFDPARYLSERKIPVPDILTIALGTNEWYLKAFNGWDLPLIVSCADWMITRLREAMPDTKIIVIPSNNQPLTREEEWSSKMSFLCAEVMRICEEKIAAGDNKLFVCSVFAHGSRLLAYNSQGTSANIIPGNTTQIATVDRNVHVLDLDDDSRADYIDALYNCIVCVM
jgi:hypothetical protein